MSKLRGRRSPWRERWRGACFGRAQILGVIVPGRSSSRGATTDWIQAKALRCALGRNQVADRHDVVADGCPFVPIV